MLTWSSGRTAPSDSLSPSASTRVDSIPDSGMYMQLRLDNQKWHSSGRWPNMGQWESGLELSLCKGKYNTRNYTVGNHLANHVKSKKEGNRADISDTWIWGHYLIPWTLSSLKPNLLTSSSQISPFCLNLLKLNFINFSWNWIYLIWNKQLFKQEKLNTRQELFHF